MGKPWDYDAVVLAGGAARRFGGTDKVLAVVGGRTLLDRVLHAVGRAHRVYVVGPQRDEREAGPAGTSRAGPATGRGVHWLREDPPGGGPLAGLAAAAGHCSAPLVVVAAADMPLLTAPVIDRLVAAASRPATDAALLVDAEGHRQPLAAAYRRTALLDALATLGDPRNKGFALLLRSLSTVTVEEPRAATDCDTPSDLQRVEAMMLTDWTRRLATELGVADDLGPTSEEGPPLDLDQILDLARDAAHAVDRPAAPVTTFLVGYAAARRGGGPEAIADCARIARELAAGWE